MNIVTLLPSATEIVCALGGGDQLVGVSHSCDYPAKLTKQLPRVTSTRVPYTESSDVIDTFVREHLQTSSALYDLDVAGLRELSPDVLVSQALCDVCAVATGDVVSCISSLPSAPALVDLNPNDLDDVLADIHAVAKVIGRLSEANILLDELNRRRRAVNAVSDALTDKQRPRVAFLEWLIPPFNGGHWNPQMVREAGGIDVLGEAGVPSRTLSWQEVLDARPDIVFVGVCGFDVKRSVEDIELLAGDSKWTELAANCPVYVADGDQYFARPGPRLIDGLEMLAHTLHPELHSRPSVVAREFKVSAG